MPSEIGYFLLVSAIICGFVDFLTSLRNHKLSPLYKQILLFSFHGQIILAFTILAYCFIASDMRVITVLLHSSSLLDLKYKLSATWGSHETSMLFWQFITSTIAIIFMLHTNCSRYKTYSISNLIQVSFLSYIIFFANPFSSISSAAADGMGMNPSLQDMGMMIHPPILFISYSLYQIIYSISIGEIFGEKFEKKLILFWSRLAFSSIFLAIGLGGWWAYRELGWGGYWFFDPVENMSLIVLLFGTILHHTLLQKNMELEKKLLSIAPFTSAIFGTFLTRSGLMSSVHSFAESGGASIILIFISLVFFTSIFLIFQNIRVEEGHEVSRKYYFIQAANLIFATSIIVIIIATLIPILSGIFFSQIIEIKNQFFIHYLIPLLLIGAVLSGLVYFNRSNIKLFLLLLLPLPIIYFSMFFWKSGAVTALSYYVASIIIIGSLGRYYERYKAQNLHIGTHSMLLGHISIGLLIFSISLNINFAETKDFILIKGQEQILSDDYTISMEEIRYGYGKNFINQVPIIRLAQNKMNIATLTPELRFYPVEKLLSREVSIFSILFKDIYAIVNNVEDEKASVRIMLHPFISFIWFSIFLSCVSIIIRNIKNK